MTARTKSPAPGKPKPKAPAKARARTPAGAPPAVHFFDAFGSMLAFLEEPNASHRRGFYGLLLRELMDAAGCEEGSLLLASSPGGKDLRLEAVHGLASEVWAGESGVPAGSAAAEAVRLGQPVRRHGAFGHSLALPLAYRGESLGAALLSRATAFSQPEGAAALAAAAGLGRVLKAFQSLSGHRQAERRLQAIVAAAAAVQRDRALGSVLARIIREAEALLDAEAASIFLLEEDGSLWAPAATGAGGSRLKDLRLAKGEGVAGWVAEHGQAARVDRAHADPRFARRVDDATQASTRSLMAVPIQVEGRSLGVLEVINKRGIGGFRADEEEPLQALALLAGAAIENSRLLEALDRRTRLLDAEVARASVDANQSRKRLEGVLFAMEDAVIAADGNGLATLLNRSAQFLTYALTGLEAMGRPLAELLPNPAFGQALQDVRSQGASLTVELDLGPEGRSYACVLAPIKDLEGYLTGFVVVLRDITRFRELERMKSAFLNTVSHELRTPITSIRAFSELMRRPGADPKRVREWSAVINEESERLNRLIDDLLDVSRLESGKQLSVVKRPVELAPLLERCVALFADQSENHPLNVHLNPDLTLAELDPDRFEQVLSNLVSNAIKYSPQGGPVELSVEFLPPESMRVEVRDHGLGLKPEDQVHLFQKFYRVEGEHLQGIRGTGLGLSITKYLVEAHGGRIGVVSAPGKGSTFWFEMPLFAAGPEAA
jgi:signal transduction histidine kinase